MGWCSINRGLCKCVTQWYLNGRLGRNWRFKSTMRAGWLLAVSNEKSRFVFGLLQSGVWGGIRGLFHQFNASRWWLMLQYFVVLSRSCCQLMIKQRKMAGPEDHSLWLQLLYNSFPYFQYWMEWKLPWHEFQPLLLCLILMLGPEGPVKRILSNVPWNWNFPESFCWHISPVVITTLLCIYLVDLTNCYIVGQIGKLVTLWHLVRRVTQSHKLQ